MNLGVYQEFRYRFWVLFLVHWSVDNNITAEATKLHGVTSHKNMFFIQLLLNYSSLIEDPQLIAIQWQGRNFHYYFSEAVKIRSCMMF